MPRAINFAIAGYGMAARMHAQALREVEDANLRYVTGRSQGEVRKFASEFNAEAGTLDEMLADDRVDAVIVCTPTGTHLDIGREIAASGKHMLVEKPLESNTKRAEELIEVCDEAGVLLGSVFQHRFNDASLRMKELQEGGLLGEPVLGSAYIKWHRGQDYYDEAPWRKDEQMAGGGALAIQGLHTIDLLLWFLGEPAEICGFTETMTHDIEVEDVAVSSIKFTNGSLGTVEASTSVYPGFPERLELHFAQGSAILEAGELVYLHTRTDDVDDVQTDKKGATGASDPAAVGIEPFVRTIEAYVDSLLNATPLMLDGREGARAVELMERIKAPSASR